MVSADFPTEQYLSAVATFLDTIEYHDENYTRDGLTKTLHHVYDATAEHFARVLQQGRLADVAPKKVERTVQTGVAMVVAGWSTVPREVQVALSIFYVHGIFLDDGVDEPDREMAAFYADLVAGRPQASVWWRDMNEYLVNVLKYYGSFNGFTIVRSTWDFYQANWIERHNFPGVAGARDYPLYLRRLSGLGQSVAATLLPACQFDEATCLPDIATVTAQIEPVVIFVNDLLSFYKEFDDVDDVTGLVACYCATEAAAAPGDLGGQQNTCGQQSPEEQQSPDDDQLGPARSPAGLTQTEVLARIARDAAAAGARLRAVLAGRDAGLRATVHAWLQGYVTWHLCDRRYRFDEVDDLAAAQQQLQQQPAATDGGDNVGADTARLRAYYADALRAGRVDAGAWAVPSVAARAAQIPAAAAAVGLGSDTRAGLGSLARWWAGRGRPGQKEKGGWEKTVLYRSVMAGRPRWGVRKESMPLVGKDVMAV